MTAAQEALYYYRNDQAPLDFTDDVATAMVTDEYNNISQLEMLLDNPGGKYSAWTNIGNGLDRNHDIVYNIAGVERFRGMLVLKRPELRTGSLKLVALGYEEILRRRALRCWARAFQGKTIYEILTSGTDRITYKVQDSGVMTTGGTGVKAQLTTTGVVNDAYTGIVLDAFKVPVSSSAYAAVKALADLINYRFKATKTVGGGPGYATTIDLTFEPKGSSLIHFNVDLGGTMMDDGIEQTEIEHAERVAVYGSKELAVASEIGSAWENSAHDFEESNESYLDQESVDQRGTTVYGMLNNLRYEGDALVTHPTDYSMNPNIDDILHVTNAQTGMNSLFRASKRVITMGRGGFDIRLWIDNNPFGYSKSMQEIKADMMILDTFRRDVNPATEPCVLGVSDDISIDDGTIYAVEMPCRLDGTVNLSPYSIDLDWDKPTLLTAPDWADDTFVKYEIRMAFAPGVLISDILVNTIVDINTHSYSWFYPGPPFPAPPYYFKVFAYFTKNDIIPTNEWP